MRKRMALLSVLVALVTAAAAAPAAANHYVFEHASLGPAGGNGSGLVNAIDSFFTSSDGTHVFFETPEALTPDDTDASSDIYHRTGGTLQRVSVGPQGGNGPHAAFPSGISDDGSVVLFQTTEQLVSTDVDTASDLYTWSSGTTTLLTTGTGFPSAAGMSRDGSRVYFESYSHFVDGDEETAVCSDGSVEEGDYRERACWDVFEVFDGVIRLVSTGPSDQHGPVDHELGDISADGSTAVFESDAGLLPEDTDILPSNRVDIYKWEDGDLSLVTDGNRNEFDDFLFLSDDGDTVVFRKPPHVFESSGGVTRFRAEDGSYGRYLGGATPDARHIFWSTYSALVPEDTDSCPRYDDPPACRDIYTHSFDGGIRLVTGGGPIVNQEDYGRFYETTRDSKKAYFLSGERIDPADFDSAYDIYEYDLASGARKLVSTGPTDTETKNPWYVGASEDGSRVFFYTEARMVPEDRDNFGDIYERAGNTTSLVTNAPGLNQGIWGFSSWYDDFTPDVDVSLDGSKLALRTNARFLSSDTDGVHDIFSVGHADLAGYLRPKSASGWQISLVQAAAPCTAPNSTHGPPLAYPSCSPPVPASPHLNAGVGGGSQFFANSTGIVRLDVAPGTPGGADDSDVAVRVQLTNVWWQSGTRVDYDGVLQARIGLRITDKDGAIPSTIADRTLSVNVPCTTTPDDAVGSTCHVVTTADAVTPGMVPERARAVWELGQVQVFDGGHDGDGIPAHDNRLFAVQGVFVP